MLSSEPIFLLVICLIVGLLLVPRKRRMRPQFVYRRVVDQSGIYSNVFSHLGLTITPFLSSAIDFYFPDSYTHVERELRSPALRVLSPKKTVLLAIDGCDWICSKDLLWKRLRDRYGASRASLLMPSTFILYDPNDMRRFHQSQATLFILKKNIQRKQGLLLTKDRDIILNAVKDDFKVVQEYMTDCLCVKGHKVNLRVYLTIGCYGHHKKFHIHRDIKCLYTNKKYEANVLDLERHITSHQLDPKIYETLPLDFWDLTFVLNPHQTFAKIRENLRLVFLPIKPILGTNRTLFPYQKKQLFGCDFLLTSSGEVRLLEINKGPDMRPCNRQDNQLKTRVVYEYLNLFTNAFEGDRPIRYT